MRRIVCSLALAMTLALAATANAAVFRFGTDPFAGSDALTTPGRQIVGGEAFISFSIATDLFSLDPRVFGVGDQVQFFNGLAGNVPPSGANIVVLQDTPDPFAAGLAATVIADRVTTPGPGFFIYFNSGLNLPRLVYSTDLSDATADLKILFRMTNLTGQPAALADFTAANFELVPEPSSLALMAVALAWAVRRRAGPGRFRQY
ncbi:MAG: PEP-CTERM sorting domain-containing protein [Vicinamibacteraceae bacterium]|nr:PEP-CTERM sorting domain-containing protein [Vicinamibacteraceae bacterium]